MFDGCPSEFYCKILKRWVVICGALLQARFLVFGKQRTYKLSLRNSQTAHAMYAPVVTCSSGKRADVSLEVKG